MTEAGHTCCPVLKPGRFLGDSSQFLETNSFRVKRCQYDSRDHLDRHRHDEPYIYVCLSGRFWENDQVQFEKGYSGYHSTRFEHSTVIGNHGAAVLNIGLKKSWFSKYAPLELERACFMHRPSRLVNVLVAQILTSIQADDSNNVNQFTHRLLPVILTNKGRDGCRSSDQSDELIERIGDLNNEELSVSTVAKRLNKHPGHLSRVFRKHFGVPLKTYLQFLKIDSACVELADLTQPIALIALKCGFFDQSHLTVCMKKLLGLTPNIYRQQFIGDEVIRSTSDYERMFEK